MDHLQADRTLGHLAEVNLPSAKNSQEVAEMFTAIEIDLSPRLKGFIMSLSHTVLSGLMLMCSASMQRVASTI